MHIYMRVNMFLLLILSSFCIFSVDVPHNWETLPVNDTSIDIVYVENQDGIPGIHATLPMKLPGDTVLSRLWDPNDPANQPENLKKREIEEDGEYTRVIRYKIQVLWATFDYRIEWYFDKVHRAISWELIDGDLECLEGYWKVLEDNNERSFVEYEAFTRPKLGFLNSFLKPIYLKEMRKFLIDKQLKLQ